MRAYPWINTLFFIVFLLLLVSLFPSSESFGSPGTYVQLASTRSMSPAEWLAEQQEEQAQIEKDLYDMTEVPGYNWSSGTNALAFH